MSSKSIEFLVFEKNTLNPFFERKNRGVDKMY